LRLSGVAARHFCLANIWVVDGLSGLYSLTNLMIIDAGLGWISKSGYWSTGSGTG